MICSPRLKTLTPSITSTTMRGIKIRWTNDMLYMLRKYFPNTDNNEVADLCPVGNRRDLKQLL